MQALLKADWQASVAARIASAFTSMTVMGLRAHFYALERSQDVFSWDPF